MSDDYFDKFRGMKPYLKIDKREWKWITENFDRKLVQEKLGKIAMEYEPPTQIISESDRDVALRRLKSIRWSELFEEGEWFGRNTVNSRYPLLWGGKPLYIRRSNVGNEVSNYFQQLNRWSVGGSGFSAPLEVWKTESKMISMIGGMYTLKQEEMDRGTLKMLIGLRQYICTQFKPSVAKALYDFFGAKRILDFSMGWGDRLAGFYASNVGEHYVGLDPRTENHPIYNKQMEWMKTQIGFFETNKTSTHWDSPAEDFDYSEYENYFDLVFTSPPYFSVEKYSYDDKQSWVRYNNIDLWNKGFLHKVMEKVSKTVRLGGHICINISDVSGPKKGVPNFLEISNPLIDYMTQELGWEYAGAIGMELAKRPNNPGAGMAKFAGEEKIDERIDGKIFCEPIWCFKKIK